MKTLIINGSPKKNGDTTALLDEFTKHLHGEVKILSCYSNIAPCNDCRYCWSQSGCTIRDEMQDVYPFLEVCDNVVLASPIWFSSLSGPLLNITSRIQTLFAERCFRGIKKEATKNGVLFLVGAQLGTEVIPEQTALAIMKHMYVRRPCVTTVYSLDTNHLPASRDEIALKGAREAALLLNKLFPAQYGEVE